MVGVILIPYLWNKETIPFQFFDYAFSNYAWALALMSACIYSFGRMGYITQRGTRLRTCEFLFATSFGSLLLMPLNVPGWNPLPAELIVTLTSACILWAGISLMWMQTFSGMMTQRVFDMKWSDTEAALTGREWELTPRTSEVQRPPERSFTPRMVEQVSHEHENMLFDRKPNASSAPPQHGHRPRNVSTDHQ